MILMQKNFVKLLEVCVSLISRKNSFTVKSGGVGGLHRPFIILIIWRLSTFFRHSNVRHVAVKSRCKLSSHHHITDLRVRRRRRFLKIDIAGQPSAAFAFLAFLQQWPWQRTSLKSPKLLKKVLWMYSLRQLSLCDFHFKLKKKNTFWTRTYDMVHIYIYIATKMAKWNLWSKP